MGTQSIIVLLGALMQQDLDFKALVMLLKGMREGRGRGGVGGLLYTVSQFVKA